MGTEFQKLNLSNSFLFAAAMEDTEICRLVLEIILGFKIPKVQVHVEHSILISSDFRSVRLDVYASDELKVGYDVEAQNEDAGNLAKRSRYYQAEMDVSSLKPGDDFSDLRPGYVIFICTFDPFGKGLYRYTFEERCLECDMPLGDGTKKIFLNTKGTNEAEVPQELVHFLKYMEDSSDKTVEENPDQSIQKLHDKVSELKQWRKLEGRYMTIEEMLKIKEKKSRKEGKAEGKAEAVIELLEDLGMVSDELREKILNERDLEILSKWHKAAARADSIEEFLAKI